MKRKSLLVKVLSVSLACLMAAGSLAGCNSGGGGEASGSQTATDGKYDLTFWTYSDMVLNDQGKLLDGWVEDFVAENDDVNSISVVAKDDADLLTSLMAGVGLPDMFCAAGRDSVSFQKAIDLLDLTPLYEEDQEWSDGFYSEARDAVTIDGKKLAVPFMTFVPLIFRNTTVLEAS